MRKPGDTDPDESDLIMIEVFLNSRKWLWALLLINVAGFLFGVWYYLVQLSATNPLLWVFILDCPLYVLLFALMCGLRLWYRDIPDWFYYLTSVGIIKYGFWTGLVVFLYWGVFFSAAPLLYSILFPLHIGMILEGLILIPRFKVKLVHMLPVLGWFLLNDWLDYFMGTVTSILPTYLDLLMWESFAATLILTLGLFLIRRV